MPANRIKKFFDPLKSLIAGWCDRRALKPLACNLPSYVAFNNKTDSWRELLKALSYIQITYGHELPEDETDTVKDLIRDAGQAING